MKSWWTTDQPQDRPRRHSHGTRLGRCRLPRRVIVQLPAAVSRSPYGRRMRSASPDLDTAPAPKGSAPIEENGAKESYWARDQPVLVNGERPAEKITFGLGAEGSARGQVSSRGSANEGPTRWVRSIPGR